MIAVQGTYDNGTVMLDLPAPVAKAKVLVIFPDEEKDEQAPQEKKGFAAYRFGIAKGKFEVPDDMRVKSPFFEF